MKYAENVVRVYPLTIKKKKMIFSKIIDYRDNVFDIEYLKSILPKINSLNEIEIDKLLHKNLDEYSKCIFLEKQFCWISKNKQGKQRYYTKGYITYSLDIMDLLSIYFNCDYRQVKKYLAELGYNPISKQDSNKANNENNSLIIDKVLSKNELMYIYLKDKIDIYKALNDFGSQNSLVFNTYKNNSIFFISIRYLKERYNLRYSISTINKVINFYALLGLVYKVPNKTIDNIMRFNYDVKSKKTKRNPILFYAIPKINNVVPILNKRLQCIRDKNIKYYNITKELYLGIQQKYKLEYLEFSGENNLKNNKSKLLEHQIQLLFNGYIRKNDVVAKEWILNKIGYTVSSTTFNKSWNKIIKNYNGRVVKPNNCMKKKYSLKTNEAVFILKK